MRRLIGTHQIRRSFDGAYGVASLLTAALNDQEMQKGDINETAVRDVALVRRRNKPRRRASEPQKD